MKKAEKKMALAVGSCVLCILLLAAGICAYYVSTALKSNEFSVGENSIAIEEDFEPPATIEAGQSYEKRVTVRNIKSVPCYVRVFAEFSDPKQADAMRINFNTTDWTGKQEDGYYYYKKVLAVGDATEPLFEGFRAEKDSANLELIVYSESVQAEGYDSAQNAFAQFEEKEENTDGN